MRVSAKWQIAIVVLISLPLVWLFLQVDPGTERSPRWPAVETFYFPGWVVGLMLLGGHSAPSWGIEGGATLGIIGQNLVLWYAARRLLGLFGKGRHSAT